MRMTPPSEEEATVARAAWGNEGGYPDYEGDKDDYDGTSEGSGEEDDTTDGGARTDGCSGNPAASQKKKKAQKERKVPVLATVCNEFTEVTESGQRIAPEAIAKGYGLQLGCIVQESMSINT